MPYYLFIPAILAEFIFLLFFAYVFFLIIQLALFNLVIIGIIIVIGKKIWQLVEALRWKCTFQYRTKDFIKFIDQQNQTVYGEMKIEVQTEREGQWLEFLLKEDEKMFEELIADRREEIFRKNDQNAISEMGKILNEYNTER